MQMLSEWVMVTACIVCAVCTASAAVVTVLVYRRCNGRDVTTRITAGDRALRKHTDKSITALRVRVEALDGRMADFAQGQGQLMQELGHCLQAKDLSPLHEKINNVSERLAETNTGNRGLREQLGILTDLIRGGHR